MKYRKDIQILRGIAVLMVVFYHLKIAGFESGFLGVDVFFVISGYLMAIMYDPTEKIGFFVKRAKRLLPAYFATVIVVLLIAIAITKPTEYNQVSSQALFANFFVSNVGFWLDSSYFNYGAFRPLLHLWSLGVEIQFYLLVPVLYWAFKKFRVALPLIFVASCAACFVIVGISPYTAFFWLPFRLWEFLLGFVVAKYIYKRLVDKNEILTWFGTVSLVAIIGISFVNVDGLQTGFMRGHPGLVAFLISIATATTLSFGIHKIVEKSQISTLLETIGNSSYSIYLVHFPVIVLVLYRPFSGTVFKTENLSQLALITALVISLSIVLFRFVEKPCRTNKNVLRWMVASVVVVLGIRSLGVMVQKEFIPEKEQMIYQAWFDRSVYRCGKIVPIIHPNTKWCEITEPINNPLHRVLLVGNSHADAIKSAFSTVAQAENVSVYFMVKNTALMKGGITPKQLIDEALVKHIDTIILHHSPKVVDNTILEELVVLAKEHKIGVSFIMPVPAWKTHIPMMLIKNIEGKESIPSQNINDYQKSNMDLTNDLNKISYDKFKIYQTDSVFCRPECQVVADDGKPLYYDTDHLTLTGSKMLIPVFSHLLSDLN